MAYRPRVNRHNAYDFVIATHSTPDQRFIDINPTHRNNEFALGEASPLFIDHFDIILRRRGYSDAEWFCKLLVVLRDNNLECRDAVSLLIAITGMSNSEFFNQISQVLTSQGVHLDETDFRTWVTDNVLTSYGDAAEEWADKLRAPHYVLAYCLMLLMGKYLDNNNYSQWFLGRKRTFTYVLGLSNNDEFITWFRINMLTCQNLYNGVRI